MAFTIYMAECPRGRRYVGCTSLTADARWRGHESSGRKWPGDAKAIIGDAINRYGKWRFKLTILATVESVADAAAIETLMIERYDAAQPVGYNYMRKSHYVAHRWVVKAA